MAAEEEAPGRSPSTTPVASEQTLQAVKQVADNLQHLYLTKCLPVERAHLFHDFYSSELTDDAFTAKPMLMVLGPYSTGKSTFIKHLIGRDYPGLNIGPEPTTDKFVAATFGDKDQRIPGSAAVADKSLPFTELTKFGNNFLERFEVVKLPSPVLKSITMVDTPGVLTCEKQRIRRGYEFEEVARWFAERSDMILILFDVQKMIISEELRRIILAVKGNTQKIRIILNKADQVESGELMRVYGAMMWTLKEVMDTPEVVRVYIGSFWDEPLVHEELRRLFESEENDIYTDMAELPRNAALRKLNDVIKRARLAKAHAYLLDYLRRNISTGAKIAGFCGRFIQQRVLIANLDARYQDISMESKISVGDFPDPRTIQDKLKSMDFSQFPRIDGKRIEKLETMLNTDMPKLIHMVALETAQTGLADVAQVGHYASPFSITKNAAKPTSGYESDWLVPPNIDDYRSDFQELEPSAEGKITGNVAKKRMVQSKLSSKVLHQIWTLADADEDGALTLAEFALAMHFIKMKQEGLDLPANLPVKMIPSSDAPGASSSSW